MIKIKNKNGYSIVEILIYSAIFTFISIFVINSFITIMSSFWVTNSNRNILESGITSLERITREIREADTASIPHSYELSLDSGAVRFVGENNTINMYENGSLIGSLNNPDTIVSNLSFTNISNVESQAIKIQMTILNTSINNPRSENFYSTIILRGSY